MVSCLKTMQHYKLEPSLPENLDYKNNLNYQQLRVVEEAQGPCLVLAGAGSGKTRVLIYRLYYLLEKGVNPHNILLVTFTNKAAKEMIHRAESLIKTNLSGLWAGTFHHIGNIILRQEAQIIGYSSNFTIIDKEDSFDLIQDCIEELDLADKDKLFPSEKVISELYSLSNNCQQSLNDTIQSFYPHLEEYQADINAVINKYCQKKQTGNILDFDDLLTKWLALLEIEAIRTKYAQLFRYVLIDEYQDTNRLQFKIIKLLSSHHNNILVVGDDAQSIYSFRGAQIKNILDFPKIFNNPNIFKLEINYRSTPEILNFANNVIEHNVNQFPKKLQPSRPGYQPPYVVRTKDVYQQAKFVGQKLIELYREGTRLKDMAILFRSRFQALELEVELMKRNIPYIIRGGVRFFEQAHIKDVMAHVKMIMNTNDELAFKRAISLHKGIGRGWAQKIWQQFMTDKKDSSQIELAIPQRQKSGVKQFFSILENLKTITNPQIAIETIMQFYKDYCYLSFDNPDERMHDLEELGKMAKQYPTIKRFLTEMSSYEAFKGENITNTESNQELVVLSTIHQAKGLEWDVVFIIGVTDSDFPNAKSIGTLEEFEEERRLLYVSATRAKSTLFITYPEIKYTGKNNFITCQPSPFIKELPKNCYNEITVEEIY